MSIDAKEWARKYLAQHERHLNDGAMDRFAAAVEFHVDLINAIADEREAATAQPVIREVRTPPFAFEEDEPQPQPVVPRADGDVPEWFGTAVRSIVLATDTMVRDAWSIASPHIARRVAEAKAELQAKFDTQTKCAQNYADESAALKQQLATATAEVERLKYQRTMDTEEIEIRGSDGEFRNQEITKLRQQLAERDATIERQRADNAAQLKKLLVADEQLAAAQAEVERLTKERTEVVRTLSELFKICAPQCTPLDYPMGLISQIDNYISGLIDERDRLRKRALPDGWEMSGSMIKRQDEIERLTKDNTKLREEVARLSRPVEDVPFHNGLTRCIEERYFIAERNAREAAEAERDELREFVKAGAIGREVYPNNAEKACFVAHAVPSSDADLDDALAAFRAEKAKVSNGNS